MTVWIDAARKPAADKYLETPPDQKDLVKFEIVDRAQFAAKVLLFNNSGSGSECFNDFETTQPGF